ncbi:hypothetical protein BDR22DRAFT_867553 [Usnea florida]
MGHRVSEANMDALNRSYARMDMERRSRARVESHPNNFPPALGSRHRSRPRTASSDLSLAKVLEQHHAAQKEQQQHEDAMRQLYKGSAAYNEAAEQRYQAKLRVEHLKRELFKHDPDQDDIDRAQRIAMQIYSGEERHHKTGRSSRSHRSPAPPPTREHSRREYTAGRGGDYDPRHGHGGRSRDFPRSDFY